MFEEKGRPRRIAHEGVTATVLAFCCNRDAAETREIYRRFWVGGVTGWLQRINA